MLRGMPRLVVLLLSLAACGCTYISYHSGVSPSGQGMTQTSGFSVSGRITTNAAGALLIAVILADGVRYYVREPDGTFTPYFGAPEADPTRRISVQDCTRPIDPAGGNLLCR